MNIVCVGGGPAGLYFSLLAKKRHPDWNIHIFERNPPNDTWGFGIVFSDDTMSGFRDADPETYEAFAENFNHWDDIHIHYKGEAITSTGHGFAGMDRLTFLQILENRASELGVTIEHNREILTLAELPDADLIVSCEGVKSFIRREHGDAFGLDIEVRPNRYIWFGTDKPFDAFTFHFKEDRHGLFRSHCYQYMSGGATFIVECTEETWRRVGLDEDDEQGSIDYCARLFEEELGGHQLVSNESRWRSFPVITNQHYFHRNMVLLGDSLHTAHFSIGSGTKLAMEDAIALADGLDAEPKLDNALRHFQDARKPAVDSLQRAARVSMEWFEETERYFGRMVPLQFAFSLLTRSLRITHDNLKSRDPELIERIDALVAETAATQTGVPRRTNPTPPPIFTPYRMRDMVLENRIAVSPMCMYSAEDGTIGDWHLVHLGSRAMGGAGLIMGEGTGISPDGRITPGCAGLYKDAHVGAWRRVVDFVHAGSAAKIGIQLCHAGRKASTKLLWEGMDEPLDDGNWPIIAPSALPYGEHNQVPREMTRADMDRVRDDFVSATERAEAAGFDLVELHCAHGYLLSSFLSPRTNRRDDDYG
ncbi:MAG: FAD-dependent monooxygenase, partial [Alphaproteobacteria bacterium]|nr:FAD-dependent monooxygenase [Alphaproteobacteria bacterium]